MKKNSSYIPEIDGLRGFAIIVIVLSHFESSPIKSGAVNFFFFNFWIFNNKNFDR